MKVALFGATGFVGSYILDSLIDEDFSPSILIREKSKDKLSIPKNTNIVSGDIEDLDAIKETMEKADAVIYNIGIIREFPKKRITFNRLHFEGLKNCVDIAEKLKVNRFILMSANGVKKNGTGYQSSKYKAEEYLKKSKLDYTIFRPSLIFGKSKSREHKEFCIELKKDMLTPPIPAPLFYTGFSPLNAGNFKLSPIHVQNVADFFVKSIKMQEAIGKTYNLGGKKSFNWSEIIDLISESARIKKWKIPVPVSIISLAAILFDRFKWFPITKGQLAMLLEGNLVNEVFFDNFNINEIEFKAANLSYLSDDK
tara:strand:- start:202 stop:1134 length:933 start_codon:yes stop_codon:yes gene_type:complete